MWELQNIALYRLCNLSGLDSLSKNWRTLDLLQKDKARTFLDISFQHKARELRYKANRISYIVAGIMLSLAFHTEDPDGFVDTVDIFLFTDLSLSAGSEAGLVARRWDTVLEISTLKTYVDTESLIQHQK